MWWLCGFWVADELLEIVWWGNYLAVCSFVVCVWGGLLILNMYFMELEFVFFVLRGKGWFIVL